MQNYDWVCCSDQMPEPIETPMDRDMENAVLLYTPVDGMVNVGWYLGPDYRGRPQWITATATDRSYQTSVKRVTLWMPVPIPNDGIVEVYTKTKNGEPQQ